MTDLNSEMTDLNLLNLPADVIDPRLDPQSAEFQRWSEQLFAQVQPYTLCTIDRLSALQHRCLELNQRGVQGDFVECGTYKGGSAAVIAQFLEPLDRHLWLYDSFAGMPETSALDGEHAQLWVGSCVAAQADLQAILQRVGTPIDRYTVRPGWFQDTFAQAPLPDRVALLHCDADWYDSVTLVLETFYDRMPVGGCVVLDDFGYWEGCREAFYDFCAARGEKPLLERVGSTQAHWFKGQVHNR